MDNAIPASCAFCEIVAGRLAATIVAQDDLTVAFLDVPHLHFHVHPRHVDDGLLRVYPRPPLGPNRAVLETWGARLASTLANIS